MVTTPTSTTLIQCANLACLHTDNTIGQKVCTACKTPLVYRYLWAIGSGIERLAPGTLIGDRYLVVASQVWLDTQPAQPTERPAELPKSVMPYLQLYPYQLHLPTIYGFSLRGSTGVLLLENVPLDSMGKPYPALLTLLKTTTAVRQVYWLWQMLELWAPLKEFGVASSLLVPDNLRVEGWRVRLRALYPDRSGATAVALETSPEERPPFLRDLATVWLSWVEHLKDSIAEPIRQLCHEMQTGEDTAEKLRAIATRLDQLLLEQAAKLPLRLKLASATSTGPQHTHNEDSCFPHPTVSPDASADSLLMPHLAIVCDGIRGHAGGEVASQLAVRSLHLQIRALVAEIAEQTAPIPPQVITQQLEAIVRIVNNLIASQNDAQGRASRQRMATTLVMALQLPQKLETATGWSNAHELYVVHLGDSRAYWLTPRYCHLLTVDDDVASREVRTGRALHREALQRPDANALTQALGTRDADAIYPTIQRFIVEEDGILLLCSDGVSDQNLVEMMWEEVTRKVLKGKTSLEKAAQIWLSLANQHNGQDNASVVLLQCQVSPDEPRLFDPAMADDLGETSVQPSDSELSEASRALLYDDAAPQPAEPYRSTMAPARSRPLWLWVLGILAGLFTVGVVGLFVWQQVNRESFEQFWNPPPPPPAQSTSPN